MKSRMLRARHLRDGLVWAVEPGSTGTRRWWRGRLAKLNVRNKILRLRLRGDSLLAVSAGLVPGRLGTYCADCLRRSPAHLWDAVSLARPAGCQLLTFQGAIQLRTVAYLNRPTPESITETRRARRLARPSRRDTTPCEIRQLYTNSASAQHHLAEKPLSDNLPFPFSSLLTPIGSPITRLRFLTSISAIPSPKLLPKAILPLPNPPLCPRERARKFVPLTLSELRECLSRLPSPACSSSSSSNSKELLGHERSGMVLLLGPWWPGDGSVRRSC